ncbi:hypothetical protein D918_00337 [Trichuris suis]|nr:hypothetical protein D918_00337 [Trichuris suis]
MEQVDAPISLTSDELITARHLLRAASHSRHRRKRINMIKEAMVSIGSYKEKERNTSFSINYLQRQLFFLLAFFAAREEAVISGRVGPPCEEAF